MERPRRPSPVRRNVPSANRREGADEEAEERQPAKKTRALPRPPGFRSADAESGDTEAAAETPAAASSAQPQPQAPAPAPDSTPASTPTPAPAPDSATAKFEVFKPRYASFKPDPSRANPSLDEILALCLAKTPSELTAVEVETLEVVPNLRGKYAEEIRAEDVKSLESEEEKRVAVEMAQRALELKEIRANIRKERAQLKARLSDSQRVIKRMFQRFRDEGIDKTVIAPMSIKTADGNSYEHVITFDNSGTMDVVDDDAEEEEEDGEEDGEEEEEDAASKKREPATSGGFIKTPPCGAFSNIIHRSVVTALRNLSLAEYVGKEMVPAEAKQAVWSVMRNEDFIREFMVSCVALSRKYNEEKKAYLEQTAREKAKEPADLVQIKVEKRDIGPPLPSSGKSSRLSSILARRSEVMLPRPPGISKV